MFSAGVPLKQNQPAHKRRCEQGCVLQAQGCVLQAEVRARVCLAPPLPPCVFEWACMRVHTAVLAGRGPAQACCGCGGSPCACRSPHACRGARFRCACRPADAVHAPCDWGVGGASPRSPLRCGGCGVGAATLPTAFAIAAAMCSCRRKKPGASVPRRPRQPASVPRRPRQPASEVRCAWVVVEHTRTSLPSPPRHATLDTSCVLPLLTCIQCFIQCFAGGGTAQAGG